MATTTCVYTLTRAQLNLTRHPSLNHNPLTRGTSGSSSGDDDDDGSLKLPHWAPKVFKYLYLAFISDEVTFLSWMSVGVVALLVLIFSAQFVIELRS